MINEKNDIFYILKEKYLKIISIKYKKITYIYT